MIGICTCLDISSRAKVPYNLGLPEITENRAEQKTERHIHSLSGILRCIRGITRRSVAIDAPATI